MKKLSVVLVSILTALVFVFGATGYVMSARAETASSVANLDVSNITNGVSFDKTNYYDVETPIGEMPRTLEAVFTINKDQTSRAGVLIGNYGNVTGENQISFEIQYNSTKKIHFPKLYYMEKTATGSAQQIFFNFENAALTPGTQYHVAIVHDTYNQVAHCYLNGSLKQTVEKAHNDADYSRYVDSNGAYKFKMDRKLRIGGDYRSGNAQYFKGAIKHIALYTDVRSESEIIGDNKRIVYDYNYCDNLILAYDFTRPNPEYLKDVSTNGFNITYTGENKYASVEEGFVFGVDQKYAMESKLAQSPSTYEAEVYLPQSVTGRGGVIVGNFEGSNTACYSFEINNNGKVRLYFDTDKNTDASSTVFDSTDIRTGDWVHVALVHDKANNKASVYIDGELKQETTIVVPAGAYNGFNYLSTYPAMVGGDWRSGNAQYFKGIIKSVALYDAPRTQEQIKADMVSVDTTDKSLTAYYNMATAESKKNVSDSSKNGNDLIYSKLWIDPEDKTPVTNNGYTFAVVGDTQWTNYAYNEQFAGIYDWILENKESKNIEYVFGVGDVTEKDYDWEWATAKKAFAKMDGVIPYSVVRGNHDTSKIHTELNYDAYLSQFDGFYEEGNLSNTYRKITINDNKFLMITLDYGASDSVLAWAGELCENNPDYKVIVSTHAYMYRDGTTLDQNDVCPPATTGGYNNGDHIWNKFVSKHENIILVLSGHDPCDDVVVRQERGVNGNMVTQMLIDHQYTDRDIGGNGMVTLLHFSEDGHTFEVECYSTVRDKFFKESNQFTVNTELHSFVEKVVNDDYKNTGATCEDKATYFYSCSCGEKGTDVFEHGEALGHDYQEIIKEEYKISSKNCTFPAKYFKSCVNCGLAHEEDTFYDEADGIGTHDWLEIVGEDYLVSGKTCTEYAIYKKNCNGCGIAHEEDTFYDVAGGYLEHDFQEIIDDKHLNLPATCTRKAKYYESCSACGERGTELFEGGEPLAHNYQEIVKTENRVSSATCTEQAVYKKSCADCGAVSDTEMFKFGAVAGHNYQNVVDDKYLVSGATCTAPAIYKASCTKCGEAHEEDTFTSGSILKHSYVYKETVAPNWSEKKNGYEIWECENDPAHTEQRNVVYWYSLSAYVSVENGTVNGEESATVEKGTSVTVIAGTYEGKVFKHWTVNGETVSENAEYTFVADGNIEVVAVFEKEPQKPASTGGCGARAMDVLALIAGLCAVMFVFKKR